MRGINVGGKNKVPMADLRRGLEAEGFERVLTYIQSGNVLLRSDLAARPLTAKIERLLPRLFKLDSSVIRVAALEHGTFKKVVTQAPRGFGRDPASYRYNVIFLIKVSAREAMKQIEARQGVDQVWQGDTVIYHSYFIPDATKSYMSRITQQPIYGSITVRNWNTTTRLLKLLDEDAAS